jgi:hypothetical protein
MVQPIQHLQQQQPLTSVVRSGVVHTAELFALAV